MRELLLKIRVARVVKMSVESKSREEERTDAAVRQRTHSEREGRSTDGSTDLLMLQG